MHVTPRYQYRVYQLRLIFKQLLTSTSTLHIINHPHLPPSSATNISTAKTNPKSDGHLHIHPTPFHHSTTPLRALHARQDILPASRRVHYSYSGAAHSREWCVDSTRRECAYRKGRKEPGGKGSATFDEGRVWEGAGECGVELIEGRGMRYLFFQWGVEGLVASCRYVGMDVLYYVTVCGPDVFG